MPRIACFISPHGYGHAARTSAVMAALQRRVTWLVYDIYTLVPRAFFEESLQGPFLYHPLLSDTGLVQHDALHEDVPETIRRLDDLLPFDPKIIQHVAGSLRERHTDLAICDISPLGIRIAAAAEIPSVLIENFTWDWIYQAYAASHPAILPHAAYLQACFHQATHHIQTQPVCELLPADLVTAPVSRPPRIQPEVTRNQLGIESGHRMVLVSMGGISEQHGFLAALQHCQEVIFVLPGAADTRTRSGNTILLPHHSAFYHPDLVHAADCVIGKVGYSTIAEVHHSGVPFGYVSRPHFRESPPLAAYISEQLPSVPITPGDFRSGAWLNTLPALLSMPRKHLTKTNGADQIAAYVEHCLG